MKRTLSLSGMILSLALIIAACNNRKFENSAANNPIEAKLICRKMPDDSLQLPQYDVLLSVNGTQKKIQTIYSCGEISKSDFKQYNIPDSALMACGGWYAGGGDYYYLIIHNNKPVVFGGWQEETQEDEGYHWKEIVLDF